MSNEAKNINLLTDFGFKRFFGTEPYKKNLIHFLNAFLPPTSARLPMFPTARRNSLE
ncbi:MAG: hypothetical protein IJT04_05890 [Bacteroidales bacterium]|nr:hypothetical protein [Bacteroidales bacterium]